MAKKYKVDIKKIDMKAAPQTSPGGVDYTPAYAAYRLKQLYGDTPEYKKYEAAIAKQQVAIADYLKSRTPEAIAASETEDMRDYSVENLARNRYINAQGDKRVAKRESGAVASFTPTVYNPQRYNPEVTPVEPANFKLMGEKTTEFVKGASLESLGKSAKDALDLFEAQTGMGVEGISYMVSALLENKNNIGNPMNEKIKHLKGTAKKNYEFWQGEASDIAKGAQGDLFRSKMTMAINGGMSLAESILIATISVGTGTVASMVSGAVVNHSAATLAINTIAKQYGKAAALRVIGQMAQMTWGEVAQSWVGDFIPAYVTSQLEGGGIYKELTDKGISPTRAVLAELVSVGATTWSESMELDHLYTSWLNNVHTPLTAKLVNGLGEGFYETVQELSQNVMQNAARRFIGKDTETEIWNTQEMIDTIIGIFPSSFIFGSFGFNWQNFQQEHPREATQVVATIQQYGLDEGKATAVAEELVPQLAKAVNAEFNKVEDSGVKVARTIETGPASADAEIVDLLNQVDQKQLEPPLSLAVPVGEAVTSTSPQQTRAIELAGQQSEQLSPIDEAVRVVDTDLNGTGKPEAGVFHILPGNIVMYFNLGQQTTLEAEPSRNRLNFGERFFNLTRPEKTLMLERELAKLNPEKATAPDMEQFTDENGNLRLRQRPEGATADELTTIEAKGIGLADAGLLTQTELDKLYDQLNAMKRTDDIAHNERIAAVMRNLSDEFAKHGTFKMAGAVWDGIHNLSEVIRRAGNLQAQGLLTSDIFHDIRMSLLKRMERADPALIMKLHPEINSVFAREMAANAGPVNAKIADAIHELDAMKPSETPAEIVKQVTDELDKEPGEEDIPIGDGKFVTQEGAMYILNPDGTKRWIRTVNVTLAGIKGKVKGWMIGQVIDETHANMHNPFGVEVDGWFVSLGLANNPNVHVVVDILSPTEILFGNVMPDDVDGFVIKNVGWLSEVWHLARNQGNNPLIISGALRHGEAKNGIAFAPANKYVLGEKEPAKPAKKKAWWNKKGFPFGLGRALMEKRMAGQYPWTVSFETYLQNWADWEGQSLPEDDRQYPALMMDDGSVVTGVHTVPYQGILRGEKQETAWFAKIARDNHIPFARIMWGGFYENGEFHTSEFNHMDLFGIIARKREATRFVELIDRRDKKGQWVSQSARDSSDYINHLATQYTDENPGTTWDDWINDSFGRLPAPIANSNFELSIHPKEHVQFGKPVIKMAQPRLEKILPNGDWNPLYYVQKQFIADDGSPLTGERVDARLQPHDGPVSDWNIGFGRENAEKAIDGIYPWMMNFKLYLMMYATRPEDRVPLTQRWQDVARNEHPPFPICQEVFDGNPVKKTWIRVVHTIFGQTFLSSSRNHMDIVDAHHLPYWIVDWCSHCLNDKGTPDVEWGQHFATSGSWYGQMGRMLEAFRYVGIVEHAQGVLANHPESNLKIPADVLADVEKLKERLRRGRWMVPSLDAMMPDGSSTTYEGENRIFREMRYNGAPIDEGARQWAVHEDWDGEFDELVKKNQGQRFFKEVWPPVSEWDGLSNRESAAPQANVGVEEVSGDEQAKRDKLETQKKRYDQFLTVMQMVQENKDKKFNDMVFLLMYGRQKQLMADAREQGLNEYDLYEEYLYPFADDLIHLGVVVAQQRDALRKRPIGKIEAMMLSAGSFGWEERAQERPAMLGDKEVDNAKVAEDVAVYQLWQKLFGGGMAITAYDPHTPNLDAPTDKTSQEYQDYYDKQQAFLLMDLQADGYEPIECEGYYSGDNKAQPTFFVPGMSTEDAVRHMKAYGQESVLAPGGLLYNDGTVLPVAKNDRGVPQIVVYAKSDPMFNDPSFMTNGYTEININGEPVRFSYDFGDWSAAHVTPAEANAIMDKFARQMGHKGVINGKRQGFFLLRMLMPRMFQGFETEIPEKEAPQQAWERMNLDDKRKLRAMGCDEDINAIAYAALQIINNINDGKAPLPNPRIGQLTAPGIQLLPFCDIGEKLKGAHHTFAELDKFARIWVAHLGFPVNLAGETAINLVDQKGDMGAVIQNATVLLSRYSAEDQALFKNVMDDVRAYLTPLVTIMIDRGLIDPGGLSAEDFIDRYMSGAPLDMLWDASNPLKARDMETVSKGKIIGFMDGIYNSLLNLYRVFYYNEFVKMFAEDHGLTGATKTDVWFLDDKAQKVYVEAPAYLLGEFKALLNRNGPEWKLLSSDFYRKAMWASRQLKIFTPAFAMKNLPRDATLALERSGVHPGALIETVFRLIKGDSKKAAGVTYLAIGPDMDSAVSKTRLLRFLDYLKNNVLGISESFMRNYSFNVERNLGGTERAQYNMLFTGTTNFSIHGSSGHLMNTWALLQFAKASLNVAQSWNIGLLDLAEDLKSPDKGKRLNAYNRAAYMILFVAAAIVFKAREKEKRELQDYIIKDNIPIRIGKKIYTIPDGFNTGATLENSISTVIAGLYNEDPLWKIERNLAEDVFAGVMGYIGRDGDIGIKSIISTMTPTLVEPIFRAVMNVSYGGRPVDSFQFGKEYTHYYNSTSEVAKKICARLHAKDPNIDMSPIKLEFVLKSYLGRYGTALSMVDDAASPGVFNGLKNAAAYMAKQPYFTTVPQGIQTQMYQDFRLDYAKIAGDSGAVKSGKLNVSPDMLADLKMLDAIHKILGTIVDSTDIFAMATAGELAYESYRKHASEYTGH